VPTDDGQSVGQAAALLGISPATLRSWQRRYGLLPSRRSPGGHRRYTTGDLALLGRVRALILAGESPSVAARSVRGDWADAGGGDAGGGGEAAGAGEAGSGGEAAGGGRARPGGPGGPGLAVPGAGTRARGLARAASQLDVHAATAIIEAALASDGVLATWDGLVRPVLWAAGDLWARTGTGVEVEHLFSEATIEALRHHRRARQVTAPASVLLACAPDEHHALPVHVLAAALAERGVASRVTGPRMPAAALGVTIRRTRATAVFVWAQLDRPDLAEALAAVPRLRPAVRVVVGGPGWDAVELPARVARAASAAEALDLMVGSAASSKLVQVAAGAE